MDLFRKDHGKKKEEEYRKTFEEYQMEEKSMQNTFLRTGIFIVAAFIAILILSVAWFVKNTSVSGTGMHIAADDGRKFYLATKEADQQGVYDDNTAENSGLSQALNKFQRINRIVNVDNQDISFQGLPQFTVGTTVITASDNNEYIVGDADGISLMVNSTSNVNNTAVEEYVGPGSRGKMTFYIIPTVSGENQVRITVSLAAYKLVASGNSEASAELIDGSDANALLRNILCGHMLLFLGIDESGDYIKQISPELGKDGTIVFSFEKEDAWIENQPIEIALYWIWPYRFENMVYPGQRDSVFKTYGSAQTALLSWVNTNKGFIVNNPEGLDNAGVDMSNSDLSKWSAGYNKGDQLIGDTVAFFTWTISAEN